MDTDLDLLFLNNNQPTKTKANKEIDKRILTEDEKGVYTSFPNQELKENKFAIRRKLRYGVVKEHRHAYIEIDYVLSGSFNQSIDGQIFEMTKGDLYIYDKTVRHAHDTLNKKHIAVNILLTQEFFDGVFMQLLSDNNPVFNFIVNALYAMNETKKFIRYHVPEESTLQLVLQNLLIEYFSEAKGSPVAINGYLLIFFAELSRELIQTNKVVNEKSRSAIKDEVLKYIRNNFKDITLKGMAENFHFHPSYLSNLIKKELGKNLKDLLLDIKMNEACHLLKNTNMSIEHLINELGYKNTSYFYKTFKKQYNCTPMDYRNKKQ
jgi:YesN/AraC family two-component response regulator